MVLHGLSRHPAGCLFRARAVWSATREHDGEGMGPSLAGTEGLRRLRLPQAVADSYGSLRSNGVRSRRNLDLFVFPWCHRSAIPSSIRWVPW